MPTRRSTRIFQWAAGPEMKFPPPEKGWIWPLPMARLPLNRNSEKHAKKPAPWLNFFQDPAAPRGGWYFSWTAGSIQRKILGPVLSSVAALPGGRHYEARVGIHVIVSAHDDVVVVDSVCVGARRPSVRLVEGEKFPRG
jgi:hypothetical protein